MNSNPLRNQSESDQSTPILFVNYPGTIGGGQVHLTSILKELNKKIFNPHVVCCNAGPFVEDLEKQGIGTTIINFGKGRWIHFFRSIPAVIKLYRLIKEKNIKLVHTHGLLEAKMAALPCKAAGIPMILVVAP